jgi:SAM-dependent methyltransferase
MAKRELDWCRIVMNEDTKKMVHELDIANIDAIEISGRAWKKTGFRSYTSTRYPEFDIGGTINLDTKYDLILAEQVFEHVRHPAAAIKNIFNLLKPGGRFMLTIPFLLKVHGSPEDFQRWTPDGLRHFLADAGFTDVDVRSWGNRQCVIAYLDYESLPLFNPEVHSLKNEPDITMQVWAMARKP